MSQLTILSDDQYNGLIDAISSGGGGGGGGSTADITAELEGIKDAIAAQSNIVASNMHIQYITSGSLDANTTTTIHCTFERQYKQVPKVLATISPVQTNFPSAYVYITSITNITLTGCDINVVRIGAALSLTENRKIIVLVEDTSIIQTAGGGSSEIIIDDNERKIGKYYGMNLFEKNVHLDSCSMGNHAHNIANIDKIISYNSFFRNNESTFNLPYVNSYQINNSVEIAINKTNIVLAGALDLISYEADITIRYTKLVPNTLQSEHYSLDEAIEPEEIEIDRERSDIE